MKFKNSYKACTSGSIFVVGTTYLHLDLRSRSFNRCPYVSIYYKCTNGILYLFHNYLTTINDFVSAYKITFTLHCIIFRYEYQWTKN